MLPLSVRSIPDLPLLPWLLLPVLLPWGRSAEVATLLCALGALWWWLTQSPASRRGSRLWLSLCGLYVLAAAVSVPASWHPLKSAEVCLGLLRYVPLGLYGCWVMRGPHRRRVVYTVTALLVACWCLDAWLQIATGWSLGGPPEPDRITGIFGAGNLKLGPALAALAAFLLWFGERQWGGRGLCLAWGWLAGPVILSGARSAWLELILVGLLFAWRWLGNWRRMASMLAVSTVLAIILASIGWHDSPRFQARVERSLQLLDGSSRGLDTALTGRLEIWGTAVRMIKAEPWTGVGVRQFRYAYPRYAAAGDHFVTTERCGPDQGACHPHQWMLEVLAETGLIGAACWLVAIVLAWRAWRSAPATVRQQAFPAGVAVWAVWFPFNTHLAFYSAWWGLLTAWLLAVWCASLQVDPAGVEDVRS
ncbi:O-antigen ligase family protein [Frateuria aurantia]